MKQICVLYTQNRWNHTQFWTSDTVQRDNVLLSMHSNSRRFLSSADISKYNIHSLSVTRGVGRGRPAITRRKIQFALAISFKARARACVSRTRLNCAFIRRNYASAILYTCMQRYVCMRLSTYPIVYVYRYFSANIFR